MPTKPPVKTQEQKLAERATEIDAIRQMQASRDAERAEWQREHDELAQRVQARRDAIDTHIKRSWAQRSDEPLSAAEFARVRAEIEQAAFEQVRLDGSIPTIDGIYEAKAVREQIAAEEAEAARIAAITPRQIWMSQMNWQDRQRVLAWEGVNKQPYPVPGLE